MTGATVVIVPCFNEADRLRPSDFGDYLDRNPGVRFLFVNDGSTDRTQAVIDGMHELSGGRVHSVRLARNLGKAEAVRLGMLEAMTLDPQRVGYWDADLSTPLASIAALCRALEESGASVALGARVKLLGRLVERKAYRHYLGRVFATMASIALGAAVYDTQCGAKMFRNDDALKRVMAVPFRVGWTFDVEILGRYKIVKGREGVSLERCVVEVPLAEWRHVPGSKITPADVMVCGLEALRLLLIFRCPPVSGAYASRFIDKTAPATPGRVAARST